MARNIHGGFSGFFSETALRILLKLGQNVLCMITDHLQKTAYQNIFRSRDAFLGDYWQDSSDDWSKGSQE